MASGHKQSSSADISAAVTGALRWQHDQLQSSLDALLGYVETEAEKAVRWYWDNKKWKARLSRWIRLWALILTASAGLLPVVSYIAKDLHWIDGAGATTSGLWASALVGVAAALIGVDRAFGFSTGWARYVLAATEIRGRLEAFRMDWIALTAGAGPDPGPEQVGALIEKAKAFRLAVEGIVTQETRDWVSEFQTNVAQLEKDVKSQLEALRAEVEKSQELQQAATQPGSIEASIENAGKAKGHVFAVTLDGAEGVVVKDELTAGSSTWARPNVKPGHYRLTVSATGSDDKPVSAAAVVVVKPAEVSRPALTLPLG